MVLIFQLDLWKKQMKPPCTPMGSTTDKLLNLRQCGKYFPCINFTVKTTVQMYRYRQSGNKSDWYSSYVRMENLDKYHGQASGVFGCDEHLAGNMPSRGTELCTVVETMFSYEILFEILGDPIFGRTLPHKWKRYSVSFFQLREQKR